jgi:hypothetical protein
MGLAGRIDKRRGSDDETSDWVLLRCPITNHFLAGSSYLSYLFPVVGEGLCLIELEGLAGDERGADGVHLLKHALQMPVSLQGGQPNL